MISSINWQRTCCAWHGEYAEHKCKDGGDLRIKKAHDIDGFLVMQFSVDGKCKTTDADGTPEYKLMTEAQLLKLI